MASLILLLAMVGSIVIVMKSSNPSDKGSFKGDLPSSKTPNNSTRNNI